MNTALARLRAKTDRQLAILIRRQFEQVRELSARGRYAEAAQIAEQVRALMAVADLSVHEREHILRCLETPLTACA